MISVFVGIGTQQKLVLVQRKLEFSGFKLSNIITRLPAAAHDVVPLASYAPHPAFWRIRRTRPASSSLGISSNGATLVTTSPTRNNGSALRSTCRAPPRRPTCANPPLRLSSSSNSGSTTATRMTARRRWERPGSRPIEARFPRPSKPTRRLAISSVGLPHPRPTWPR